MKYFLFLFSIHTFAFECNPPLSKSYFIDKIQNIMDKNFQELSQHNKKGLIKLRFFNDDAYFFKTMFKLTHALKKREQRILYLDVNQKILSCPPSEEAIESILVHEMFHLKDYLHSKTKDLIRLGGHYLSQKSRAKYERFTDLRTMQLKHAQGLIEYRRWIYEKLNNKQLKKKKILYYTPMEIEQWLSEN